MRGVFPIRMCAVCCKLHAYVRRFHCNVTAQNMRKILYQLNVKWLFLSQHKFASVCLFNVFLVRHSERCHKKNFFLDFLFCIVCSLSGGTLCAHTRFSIRMFSEALNLSVKVLSVLLRWSYAIRICCIYTRHWLIFFSFNTGAMYVLCKRRGVSHLDSPFTIPLPLFVRLLIYKQFCV